MNSIKMLGLKCFCINSIQLVYNECKQNERLLYAGPMCCLVSNICTFLGAFWRPYIVFRN